MAGKSEKGKDKGEKKEKSQKVKKLLVVLAILFGLAGSSAGAYSFFLKKPDAPPAGKKKTYSIETTTMDMGEMLVNLSGNGGIRYLKVKIVVEYPKDKKIEEELKKKNHIMSDIIITTLRKKNLTEVYDADAVLELKNDIIENMNENLDYGDITGIYFTDFLVQ